MFGNCHTFHVVSDRVQMSAGRVGNGPYLAGGCQHGSPITWPVGGPPQPAPQSAAPQSRRPPTPRHGHPMLIPFPGPAVQQQLGMLTTITHLLPLLEHMTTAVLQSGHNYHSHLPYTISIATPPHHFYGFPIHFPISLDI